MFDLKINNIYKDLLFKIHKAQSLQDYKEIKNKYFGKKGLFILYIKEYTKNNIDLKNKIQTLNKIKYSCEKLLHHKIIFFNNSNNNIDISVTGYGQSVGTIHPINISINKINKYFYKLNFNLVEGCEIESKYYNFDALNIPLLHPSRNINDTFYLKDYKQLLRTHTSGIQIKIMEKSSPPIKIISSGKVYRRDSDITHTPMFHQIEGLHVDKDISFSYLKSLMHNFLNYFFEKKIKIRFRPSYFPFTEPSAEIDIECFNCCNNQKIICNLCKNTKWIEVMGCGMVHPIVFKYCDINCDIYQGIAFGLGIERLTMLYYQIHDIRSFFINNVHFLDNFNE